MDDKRAADGDLLYGAGAIAQYLGMSEAQVYHLHRKGNLPSFKIGAKVSSSKSKLDEWVREGAASD